MTFTILISFGIIAVFGLLAFEMNREFKRLDALMDEQMSEIVRAPKGLNLDFEDTFLSYKIPAEKP